LRQQIHTLLKVDRQERARRVGETAVSHLKNGNLQEAWYAIQGSPKPCRQTLQRQTHEWVELYTNVDNPGDTISINVQPCDVRDDAPANAELRPVVRGMRNGRGGGASKIRAET